MSDAVATLARADGLGAPAAGGAELTWAAADERVEVQIAAHSSPAPTALKAWARAALGDERRAVCIRIVEPAESRALNARFRDKPRATNVLAFPADAPSVLGDLAICAEVVEREAEEHGQELAARFAHMVVHGVLHLRGMDHQDAAEAARMEAAEARVLAALGFGDPYTLP